MYRNECNGSGRVIMRKLCALLLLLLTFSIAFPVSASETSTYTVTEPSLLQQESKIELPAEETHEVSISEETDGPSNDGWFSSLDIAYTVSSLFISLIVCGLIALICKKELPQKDITIHTFLLFISVVDAVLIISINNFDNCSLVLSSSISSKLKSFCW